MSDWSDCRSNAELQGEGVGRKMHRAGEPCPPRPFLVMPFTLGGMRQAYRRGMRTGWLQAAAETSPSTTADALTV
jgi:hypothetical protein